MVDVELHREEFTARLAGVDVADLLEDSGGVGAGRKLAAHDEVCVVGTPLFLADGDVGLPAGVGLDVGLMQIGNDADDTHVVHAGEVDDAADGVMVGEEEVGGLLVDDDDQLAGVVVGPCDVAAGDVHSHGFEEAGADHVDKG